jgi:hypothetical protein
MSECLFVKLVLVVVFLAARRERRGTRPMRGFLVDKIATRASWLVSTTL